jgi:alpha-glucosidase
MTAEGTTPTPWWQDAVLYQIYPRSYGDTNGDGIGDLAGIVAHLDHLEWLGIDAIWISPITVSPNADWGYDVADYCDVDPALGTLDDLDALVAAAAARGIRVVLDLVPNHTSSQHPWFVDARASRDAEHRDWYVWADPAPDGGPPNNWVSSFGGPAWTLDPTTGQYYLHNFFPEQPDLNWWNDAVRDEFDGILRFWFDRGVAGFRIDVAHMVVKDRELRDNPPIDHDDDWIDQVRGQRPVYNSSRPEVHDVYRRWRAIAREYDPERLLLGETHVQDLATLARFYGNNDELGLAFNFPFVFSTFAADLLRAVVDGTIAALPEDAWPVWTLSNHDVSRMPTRWCDGDDERVRCALLLLLTLRGTPVLYYGDELGLPDTVIPVDRLVDPVSIMYQPVHNRDAARTPMPWTDDAGAGFTTAGVEPWLPCGDLAAYNVADQRADPRSTLHFTRALLALRREYAELRSGELIDVGSADDVWTYRRGEQLLVVLHLGSGRAAATMPGPGVVLLDTHGTREGETVSGSVEVEGWRGLLVALD